MAFDVKNGATAHLDETPPAPAPKPAKKETTEKEDGN